MNNFFYKLFCLTLLIVHCCFANDEVVDISSKELIIDRQKEIATYKKEVVVLFDDIKLYSDKLIIYYSNNQQAKSVDKIIIPGKVKAVKNCGEIVVVSDRGEYNNKSKLLKLLGNVKILKGGSYAFADEVTYKVKIKYKKDAK